MIGSSNEFVSTDVDSDENSNGISTNSSNTYDKNKPLKKKQARVNLFFPNKFFLILKLCFLT
jgi:hypothetical protein